MHRAAVQENTENGEVVRVTMRRSYPTDAADLWSALTEPERIARWFLPVSGDLREGGSFQLEGNAGGDILTAGHPSCCVPPSVRRTVS